MWPKFEEAFLQLGPARDADGEGNLNALSASDQEAAEKIGGLICDFSQTMLDSNLEGIKFVLGRLVKLRSEYPIWDSLCRKFVSVIQSQVKERYSGLQIQLDVQ